MRSQLTCLPCYIDAATARQITYTWAALSSACHYHPYELAPTAAELTGWVNDVAKLITQIVADAPGSPEESRSATVSTAAEPATQDPHSDWGFHSPSPKQDSTPSQP